MARLIARECGVDIEDDRFVILGAQDVDGFEAVALGEKVDVDKVTPGMIKLCQSAVKAHPTAKAFLFECTELPPYSDAVRQATGLPVYDAVTNCDFFITGFRDNERFGIGNWQKNWDGQQDEYQFGQELSKEEQRNLKSLKLEGGVNKDMGRPDMKVEKIHESVSLGIVRLDYNYEAAPGDIDHPDSYGYDVFYYCVPGLTFDKCQAGELNPQIQKGINNALEYLINKK
jgi:hypothetical protein